MTSQADKLKALNLLALRRAARGARRKGGRLRKPPRILYPAGAERDYVKSLNKIVSDARGVVESRLVPALPALIAQAQARRPSTDNALDARLDDYGDAVRNLLELIRGEFFGRYSAAELAALSRRIGVAVAAQNGREVGKVFKDVLGVDLFQAEPWMHAEADAFVAENVALIRTIPERYFDQVEQLVFQGASQGRRWEELAADLRDSPYGTTKRRAELIARDQVAKFNGRLAKLRQTQAGVERYTWRTSRDGRVRHDHKALEGKVFAWSAPPVVDTRSGRRGHPGDDFQCRCYAEPVLDDVLDDLADDDAE